MAGRETPRQKMINMMYLIFIAMLALNMSKEVLTAFGSMTEELSETNVELQERNDKFMQGLEEKAEEQALKYLDLKLKADSIRDISEKFYTYLETLKDGAYQDAASSNISKDDYEKLDKTVYFDELFFDGIKFKEEGQLFLNQMNSYRDEFYRIAASDPKLESIADEVKDKFNTNDVQPKQGKAQNYLDYNFKGFPLIASITKLTLLQSSIKNIEAQLLSTMLEGKLKIEASLTNFDAIVIPDKTAFFVGENFTGRIILGKNDKTLRADKVIINGRELDQSSMEEGKTLLNFPAGRIGDNDIDGEFQFTEEGETISIPVKSTYAVVAKPNEATISADKMRVVYRGVENPISISFSGIPDRDVNVSAPGINKVGTGAYMVNLKSAVQELIGKDTLRISVAGKLTGGGSVTSSADFRIKSLPIPIATIAGEYGLFEFGRADLASTRIRAKFDESFAFDLPLSVYKFTLTVPGQPPIDVRSSRFNEEAQSVLRSVNRGAIVTISDIKVRAEGTQVTIKDPPPLSIRITD